MTTQQIDKLLEDYLTGDTTSQQEQTLHQLAERRQLPDSWNDYFAALADAAPLPEGLLESIESEIDRKAQTPRRHWWRKRLAYAAAAAVVAAIVTAGILNYNRQRRVEQLLTQDTCQSPEEAYLFTALVLTDMSQHINQAVDDVNQIHLLTDNIK